MGVASSVQGRMIAVAAIDSTVVVAVTARAAPVGEMVQEPQLAARVKQCKVEASRATKISIKFPAVGVESSTTRLILATGGARRQKGRNPFVD